MRRIAELAISSCGHRATYIQHLRMVQRCTSDGTSGKWHQKYINRFAARTNKMDLRLEMLWRPSNWHFRQAKFARPHTADTWWSRRSTAPLKLKRMQTNLYKLYDFDRFELLNVTHHFLLSQLRRHWRIHFFYLKMSSAKCNHECNRLCFYYLQFYVTYGVKFAYWLSSKCQNLAQSQFAVVLYYRKWQHT